MWLRHPTPCIRPARRKTPVRAVLGVWLLGAATAGAQTAEREGRHDTSASRAERAQVARSGGHWWRFAVGFGASIAVHELSHVAAAYAAGGRPSFGFDAGRPTVYSGLDRARQRRAQFAFSSAGLTAQMLLDEAILDLPHRRGGAFERGVLAGGIGTVVFYTTLGRNASVSDVTVMSETSSLSKTEISLIYGSIAALHAVRIARDGRYANFFAAPQGDGGVRVGVVVRE